jgi:hypothetical protein
MHEKIINIPSHKGNANQNYTEISLHFSQDVCHKEHKQQQMLARIQEKNNPHTQLVETTVWRFLKKN